MIKRYLFLSKDTFTKTIQSAAAYWDSGTIQSVTAYWDSGIRVVSNRVDVDTYNQNVYDVRNKLCFKY